MFAETLKVDIKMSFLVYVPNLSSVDLDYLRKNTSLCLLKKALLITLFTCIERSM